MRRAAMARARDTGLPAASGQVTLVQEVDPSKQSGFLIYTPVYMIGRTPVTVAQRRSTLLGFVYAPFCVGDLLAGIFGTQKRPELGFEIRDAGRVLHRTPELPVWLAGATLFGGLIIASLLFSLLRVQLQARDEAERTAERLAASEAALHRANQAKDDFLATLSTSCARR